MLKLKTLITEQEQFKAKSKETGRTIVYKSKDAMDKAIKGGTAEPLDKKTSDKTDGGKPEKVKGADLFKKTDVVGKDKIELGTKIKDGKIKSSGPQQFADDVKDMKGEYELDGGMKIKDGKCLMLTEKKWMLMILKIFTIKTLLMEKVSMLVLILKKYQKYT